MPDATNLPEDDCVGFDLSAQKLHCLIALNDALAPKLSNKAGDAFFRAFVVENRETGEVLLNQRFRYNDGDSWMRVRLAKDKQALGLKEKVEYLADGIEFVMRAAVETFAGGAQSPKDAVTRFYPPNPDDSRATLDWLVAQDLVEITQFYGPKGNQIPVAKGTDTAM
jgi:hypothetical protein